MQSKAPLNMFSIRIDSWIRNRIILYFSIPIGNHSQEDLVMVELNIVLRRKEIDDHLIFRSILISFPLKRRFHNVHQKRIHLFQCPSFRSTSIHSTKTILSISLSINSPTLLLHFCVPNNELSLQSS